MNENAITAKSVIAAALTAAAAFLGWKGILMFVWVSVMALDYLSGTLAACREGQWSSAVARQGLWHKGGMILVVTVAAISDGMLLLLAANMPLQAPSTVVLEAKMKKSVTASTFSPSICHEGWGWIP